MFRSLFKILGLGLVALFTYSAMQVSSMRVEARKNQPQAIPQVVPAKVAAVAPEVTPKVTPKVTPAPAPPKPRFDPSASYRLIALGDDTFAPVAVDKASFKELSWCIAESRLTGIDKLIRAGNVLSIASGTRFRVRYSLPSPILTGRYYVRGDILEGPYRGNQVYALDLSLREVAD